MPKTVPSCRMSATTGISWSTSVLPIAGPVSGAGLGILDRTGHRLSDLAGLVEDSVHCLARDVRVSRALLEASAPARLGVERLSDVDQVTNGERRLLADPPLAGDLDLVERAFVDAAERPVRVDRSRIPSIVGAERLGILGLSRDDAG